MIYGVPSTDFCDFTVYPFNATIDQVHNHDEFERILQNKPIQCDDPFSMEWFTDRQEAKDFARENLEDHIRELRESFETDNA